MQLLKFNPNFEIEKLLKDTKYPLSKNLYKKYINIIYQNKDKNNEKINLDDFINKLDSFVKKENIDIITMKYCKTNEEREKFKVHIISDKLYFYSSDKKEYLPIDSLNLFKKYFNGRTPKKDDEYLIQRRHPFLKERLGKSTCSCFIIDKNKDLFISPYRQDTIQHSFITNCSDVLSAGLIFCENGKILYIENRAGHYLPNQENILYFFEFLNEKKEKNLSDYFHKDFEVKRDIFLKNQDDIINNKEYGLNFFSFKEKTPKEMKNESQLRNYLFEKYFNLTFNKNNNLK